jgi:4-hydroxy-tetrahydrodipicolinate reductase
MTVRVGVFGAGGRMGSTVCDAVAADPDLELVAAVDPFAAGSTVHGLTIASGPREMADAGVQVAVDFTTAEAARTNLSWCALHGVHAVVGTTGLTDDDFAGFARDFTRSTCLVAANFAISAVLMMRFAEIAAPFFDTAEIIELHHDRKVDAPSGTAFATAQRMASAKGEWPPDPTTHEVVDGARGGRGPGGIHLHSVRMRGMVAHQEVILGAESQSLTLRQDSYDRMSFMPGVVLACKRVSEHTGLVVGLDPILGL